MIFVNSMSDLFQKGVPFDFVVKVWEVMRQASHHTFQILTKRPERMQGFVSQIAEGPPLPNVWLGTSVESADQVERIDLLRSTPASVRFVSFEPLIGSIGQVDLRGTHWAIVGGESGPHARPLACEWVEEVMRACRASGVAFFFKQWGGVNKKAAGREFRGRTWDEYPAPSSAGVFAEHPSA
jgi:protein gp37